MDKNDSICYDSSSLGHHAALEAVEISREIDLVKVYESLNFPISLLTLLPKNSDKKDDINGRVKVFFSILTQFLMMDKQVYFEKFISCKGHQMVAEIIRNENLPELGLQILNPILNLRRVSCFSSEISFQ